MKLTLHSLLMLVFCSKVLAMTNQAEPCREIIADTMKELEIGAGSWWTNESARAAKLAAASACLKAHSGKYLNEASTVDGPKVKIGFEPETQEAEVTTTDDKLFDLDFRPINGSPGRKPFERKRKSENLQKP